MKMGQVVFLFAQRSLQIGRVIGQQPGRLEVETPQGDRRVIPERRLAHRSARTVPTIAALVAYEQELCDLQKQIDLGTVWSILESEPPSSRYTVESLSNIALPAGLDVTDDATAAALFEDSIYFKRKKDGSYARNTPRAVEDRKRAREAAERAKRELAAMVGWYRDSGDLSAPYATRTIEALEALALYDDTTAPCKLARTIIAEAIPESSEADTETARQRLVDLGIWSPHENLALLRAKIPRAMPPAVTAAAASLRNQPLTFSGRADYRHLPTVAIDDRFTTEVDDAIACVQSENGSQTVYVFITDAAAWVEKDSLIDREAYQRGATVYIPEGKLPMIPSVLSEGMASLEPGTDRLALCFAISLDAEGEIRHFDIEEAVIQVDQRLTYESVDTILAGEAHELQALLVQLSKAASALREARIEGGSLTVDRQEVSVHRQDEQTVDVTTYRTDDPSRKLVSEWMIQTCMLTAEWCRERGLATLYRAQTAPNPRPKIPRGRALSRHEQMRILRTMRRAVITTDPEPHNGLGVPAYTQVTSPLRRYADLVMHRQIKDVLATRRQGQGTAQLLELAAHITELHEKHVDIERKSRRYWILRSMESRVGTCFEVEVLRESGRRVIIEVLENNLQTSWEPDSPARRGEVLNLTLTCADARANRLTFRS